MDSSECIPLILGGGDVLASSETGSGKTAAFVLPTIQICWEERHKQKKHDNYKKQNHIIPDCHDLITVQNKDFESKILILKNKQSNSWTNWRSSIGTRLPRIYKNNKKINSEEMEKDIHNNFNYYWECKVLEGDGIVRLGLSVMENNNKKANDETNKNSLGTDAFGWGYGGTGWKVHNNEFVKVDESFGTNDVIGCLFQNNSLYFTKNGVPLQGNKPFFSSIIKPTSDDHHAPSLLLFPTISMKQKVSCQVHLNLSSFQYTPSNNISSIIRDFRINLNKDKSNLSTWNPNCLPHGPFAIVLEPTRDLARQTYLTFLELSKYVKNSELIRTELLVGGNDRESTSIWTKLQQNQVDILVGTPHIVASYVQKYKPTSCQLFVLDEADQLVSSTNINNNDFLPNIYSIYTQLVKSHNRKQKYSTNMVDEGEHRFQVCFFSATLRSLQVQQVTSQICQNPIWIDLKHDISNNGSHDDSLFVNENVHHVIVQVNNDDEFNSYFTSNKRQLQLPITDAVHRKGVLKEDTDTKILKKEELQSEYIKLLKPIIIVQLIEKLEMEQVLIFCRTNLDCDLMEQYFNSQQNYRHQQQQQLKVGTNYNGFSNSKTVNQFDCRVLAGSRSTHERNENLRAFKNGEIRILIATDAAARGIDIRELPYVINVTLPDQPETYIHRVGRVGRAQRIGLALSIIVDSSSRKNIKEKVWYCQQGEKPPCSNTNLYENGGNCIWYDEYAHYQKIEKILKENNRTITRLVWPKLELPPLIASIVQSKGYGERLSTTNEVKGQDKQNSKMKSQIESIQDKVTQLQMNQYDLENEFWTLHHQQF